MRSKCVLNKNNKNTNLYLRTQTHKLKIPKSQFPQSQQNHQILKPQSTKSIQKYNTTNPNKKISNSEKPISSKLNPANPPQASSKPTTTTKPINQPTLQSETHTNKSDHQSPPLPLISHQTNDPPYWLVIKPIEVVTKPTD